MKVFLSYASEDRPRAEEIALALEAGGHDVFFDRHDLAGGQDYHAVIREWIAAADLFVFLITPRSVEEAGYTLTELRLARQRWPRPEGSVLPVLLEPTDLEAIPAYLRSVTLFEPEGNAAAEIAAHLAGSRPGRRLGVVVAAALVVALAVGGGFVWLRGAGETGPGGASFVSSIEASQFVSGFVFAPDSIERTQYSLDPTSRLAAEGEEMVRLERVAFGFVESEERPSAFNLDVRISNPTGQPIRLDLTPRFFELADDRGLAAELLYFCCPSAGDLLAPGDERSVQLIYRSAPDWEGKEVTGGMIRFRISGLLPVVQATWSFLPLATAE
jgi:hypothetical protein